MRRQIQVVSNEAHYHKTQPNRNFHMDKSANATLSKAKATANSDHFDPSEQETKELHPPVTSSLNDVDADPSTDPEKADSINNPPRDYPAYLLETFVINQSTGNLMPKSSAIDGAIAYYAAYGDTAYKGSEEELKAFAHQISEIAGTITTMSQSVGSWATGTAIRPSNVFQYNIRNTGSTLWAEWCMYMKSFDELSGKADISEKQLTYKQNLELILRKLGTDARAIRDALLQANALGDADLTISRDDVRNAIKRKLDNEALRHTKAHKPISVARASTKELTEHDATLRANF